MARTHNRHPDAMIDGNAAKAAKALNEYLKTSWKSAASLHQGLICDVDPALCRGMRRAWDDALRLTILYGVWGLYKLVLHGYDIRSTYSTGSPLIKVI